jgi:hypothetical protein
MDLNLVTENEASLLVCRVLVAYVHTGEWDFILSFDVTTVSSSLFDVLFVVEASSGTSKSSSLTVLKVNLNLVIHHAL